MITARLFDGGTVAMSRASAIPGCAQGYYRDGDFEEDPFAQRVGETNAIMRGGLPWAMAPWPEDMPPKLWIDWCDRYAGLGDDGLHLQLYHHDLMTDAFDIVPGCDSAMDLTPEEEIYPEQARIARDMDWREVQEIAADPQQWYRLDTEDEAGAPQVGQPVLARWRGVRGPGYRLVMPDQSLWAPFDLRLGLSAYQILDGAGEVVPASEAERWFDLTQRGHFSIYLRPRRWRWVVTVLAHFLWISAFEEVPNDETFLKAYFDRPPTYPYRHDLLHTSQETPLSDFYGSPRSYDLAIDYAFSQSRASAALEHEILSSQYTIGPCLAYIFIGCELPDIALWRYAPLVGEIVCGIGQVDAGGDEQRVWVQQIVDTTATYRHLLLGQYLSTMFSVESA